MDNTSPVINAEYEVIDNPSEPQSKPKIEKHSILTKHSQKVKDNNRSRKKLTLKMKRHTRKIGKFCK